MGIGEWYGTSSEQIMQTAGDINEHLRESYNAVARTADARREAFMQELEDRS